MVDEIELDAQSEMKRRKVTQAVLWSETTAKSERYGYAVVACAARKAEPYRFVGILVMRVALGAVVLVVALIFRTDLTAYSDNSVE